MSNTDGALRSILATLLKLLEVSELQAVQEQSNHTAQLRSIESALTKGSNIDVPQALNTFSNIITSVADNTSSLIEVNNELVKSHKEQNKYIETLLKSHEEQEKNINKLIASFETLASRTDVLTLATQKQAGIAGLGNVFEQIEVANTTK